MPFDGTYPAVPGNKKECILDLYGPASYAPIVIGTPPSGGQVINASQFGLQYIEYVEAMSSNDAQYDLTVTITPQTMNRPGTGVIVGWYVASGRGQVAAGTNLSNRWIRLLATGY